MKSSIMKIAAHEDFKRSNIVGKSLRDLNLDDDFLFAKVMSDKEICKKVL